MGVFLRVAGEFLVLAAGAAMVVGSLLKPAPMEPATAGPLDGAGEKP